MERQYPIAYIGEEFEYFSYKVWDYDRCEYIIPNNALIYATVLQVSRNHFTGEYVYKIRKDFPSGWVDEAWYTKGEVEKMKEAKIE